MLRTRLLRSLTFRLTLAFFAIFSLSALALLAYVYMSSVRYMERQTAETIEAEITGLAEQYRSDGLPGLRRVIAQRAADESDLESVYLLTDREGGRIAGNINRWPKGIESEEGGLRFAVQGPGARGRPERLRVLARAFVIEDRVRLLVGRQIEDKLQTQGLLLNVILWGGLVMALVGVTGGYVLSRWMLGRLEEINGATNRIMAGRLDLRIPVKGRGDEFDELAAHLNAMLERIERLVAGMREVTDNIAHDLRTPLTRLRSRIEVALMGRLDEAETRELLEATVGDAEDLINTFNALLNIARAEAGAQRANWETVDLEALAHDVAELYEPLAEEKAIRLELETRPGCHVFGSRELLAQALANLTDNAIKYTPEEGRVWIATRAGDGAATLEVRDSGPGIPGELRERALERFVRLDTDRSRPGNGLGLSLVKAVARLHEAELELADNNPGLAVRLTFRAPPKPQPPSRETATTAEGETVGAGGVG